MLTTPLREVDAHFQSLGHRYTETELAEVSKLDMKVEGGKVVAYRARVSLSFKYDA